MSFSTFAALLSMAAAVAAVLWACWKTLVWLWVKPKMLERRLREEGFAGNPYRLLFGDMNDIAAMRKEAQDKPIPFTNHILPRVIPQLHSALNIYGKDSFVWMGTLPMVQITQPELIREVFTRMNDFGKVKLNPLTGLLAPGLARLEGDKWAKHRRLLTPAFHVEKLKLMLPSFYVSCVEMISTLETKVQKTGSIDLDVWPHLVKLTADVISRAAFGSSFEEGRMIFELLKEQVELTVKISLSINIPGWRFMPTKTNRKMSKVQQEIQSLLMGIVQKRKKAMEAGEEAAKDDLLGILMESAFKQEVQSDKLYRKKIVEMSMDELIEECKLFYFAGQETTSTLLAFTLVMLSKHQEWQERAREEVFKTFKNQNPDFDRLNQLKIMRKSAYHIPSGLSSATLGPVSSATTSLSPRQGMLCCHLTFLLPDDDGGLFFESDVASVLKKSASCGFIAKQASSIGMVTMILHEVLRLYPPVVELSKMTTHDVELGKFSLPAGVMVNMPMLLAHQDPDVWGADAMEFRPERFSEGILKATRGKNAFFPFGWGPRICIGQNFGLVEAKMAMVMILQRFSFELSPSYVHAPVKRIILQPQFGAHIVLHQL